MKVTCAAISAITRRRQYARLAPASLVRDRISCAVYATQDFERGFKPVGKLPLDTCAVLADPRSMEPEFQVSHRGTVWSLRAPSEDQRNAWISQLRAQQASCEC